MQQTCVLWCLGIQVGGSVYSARLWKGRPHTWLHRSLLKKITIRHQIRHQLEQRAQEQEIQPHHMLCFMRIRYGISNGYIDLRICLFLPIHRSLLVCRNLWTQADARIRAAILLEDTTEDDTLIDSWFLVSTLGDIGARACWFLQNTKVVLALSAHTVGHCGANGSQWAITSRVVCVGCSANC